MVFTTRVLILKEHFITLKWLPILHFIPMSIIYHVQNRTHFGILNYRLGRFLELIPCDFYLANNAFSLPLISIILYLNS